MNVQQQLLRDAIHQVDYSCTENELAMSGEEVESMAVWPYNSSYGGDDSCPCMRALGHVPRDPLQTCALTTSQAEDPSVLKRFMVRIGYLRGLRAKQMKTRLERMADAQTRTGMVGEDCMTRVKAGDEVDAF